MAAVHVDDGARHVGGGIGGQQQQGAVQVLRAAQAALRDALDQGFAPAWKTPADTARFLDVEVEKWAGVVKTSGATVN